MYVCENQNNDLFSSEFMSGGSRFESDMHSKNPRVYFAVTKADEGNEYSSQAFLGKAHVVISLLQDYRHGPSTANSLLFPVGFCVYKVI